MTDTLLTLLSSGVVSAALASFVVWLSRTWIGERLHGAIQAEYSAKLETLKTPLKAEADVQIETHKSALKAQSDVELERLRASLTIAAAERHALYSTLLLRRFDAIAAVHGPLLRFYRAVHQLVQPLRLTGGPSDKELADAVHQASVTFEDAYTAQKIFMPKALSDRIDAIRQALVSNANVYQLIVVPRQGEAQQWLDVYQKVNDEIPTTIAALETELRGLMGDDEDTL